MCVCVCDILHWTPNHDQVFVWGTHYRMQEGAGLTADPTWLRPAAWDWWDRLPPDPDMRNSITRKHAVKETLLIKYTFKEKIFKSGLFPGRSRTVHNPHSNKPITANLWPVCWVRGKYKLWLKCRIHNSSHFFFMSCVQRGQNLQNDNNQMLNLDVWAIKHFPKSPLWFLRQAVSVRVLR